MATQTPNQALTTYVGDMHALVTHGLQAVERQIENLKEEGHPEAYNAVQEVARTLRVHASMLDARTRALGGSATKPVKDAVSAIAGVAAGLINAVRSEEASKSIRDDYTFLSHAAIGYLMLYTTAASLADNETAQLAQTGYQDVARLAMQVDHIMPTLVIQELMQDGLRVTDVSSQALRMVKQAWSHEASTTAFAP